MFPKGWLTLLSAKLILMGPLLFLLGGCGYSLSHRLKDQFQGAKIYVPYFYNQSNEVGAEAIFTHALIRELNAREPGLAVYKDDATHDLQGTIRSINISTTASTEPGYQGLQVYRRLPSELGVFVEIELALIDKKNGNQVWKNTFRTFRRASAKVDRSYDYQAPSSVSLFNQSLYEYALRDLAPDLVREFYDDLVEFF